MAALATLDSEFGRTTDPVRMYMREMGTVDLLTREGEIKIAKRIEKGLNQALRALAEFPPAVEALLEEHRRFEAGGIKLTDIISSFVDPTLVDRDEPILPASKRNPEDEKDNEEAGGSRSRPRPRRGKGTLSKARIHSREADCGQRKGGFERTGGDSGPHIARRSDPGAQADSQAAGPPDATAARHDQAHPDQRARCFEAGGERGEDAARHFHLHLHRQ